MEQIYALGISCIEIIQEWFADSEWYFELVNNISNPYHITEIFFPVICIIDSVFGAQLLLCMAFGGWLNCIMKWWFQEDRPYWWIRETSFYDETEKPYIRQTIQTCETGPGSPSGHSTAAAITILLVLMWIKHIMHDRKFYISWWTLFMYPLSVFAMSSVIMSRLYIATHFPHQCIIGAFIGAFLAPALCIYLSDPYIWRYGSHSHSDHTKAQRWHVIGSVGTVVISLLAYYSMVLTGHDPQWTVKLAFRWCEFPQHIHVSSTPIFALVQATANLLGLALSVTPAIAEYRHYTKHRSTAISAITIATFVYSCQYIVDNVCKSNTLRFYSAHFIISALKPMLLLRVAPAIAMWPFERPKHKTE